MQIAKATKENKMLKWFVKHDSHLVLLHHRLPTSTINTKRTAHPFTTGHYFGDTQYILAHNGGIENADELLESHEKLGITYHTLVNDVFNDSEALLWDFALYMEGKQKEILADGAMAFICLKVVKGKLEKLYFGRNWERPLVMNRDKESISLASEGSGEYVNSDTLYTWHYKLKRLTKKKLDLSHIKSAPYYEEDLYGGHYDKDGVWVPETKDDEVGDWISPELRQKFGLKPKTEIVPYISPDMVNAELWRYLVANQGKFSDAYWAMEGDYQMIENRTDYGSRKQQRLLMKAIEKLEKDPNWQNEDDVSLLWRNR